MSGGTDDPGHTRKAKSVAQLVSFFGMDVRTVIGAQVEVNDIVQK